MNVRERRIRTRLAAALVVAAALVFSPDASSQQKTTPASDTSIAIRAVSSSVKAGGPVWVDVNETNNSDKIQIFSRQIPMDQGGNTYITDVWDNEGVRCVESTFYRKFQGHLTPEERREAMSIEAVTIDKIPMYGGSLLLVKPGGTVKYRMDVGKLYDLSKRGTYTIQVQLPAQSNRITVTVVP